MRVTYRRLPYGKCARGRFQHSLRRYPARLQRRGHRKRLQGGPRLEYIRNGPVTRPLPIHARSVIWIVCRQIDQREYLACLRIQYNDPARFGFVGLYCLLQFPVGEILNFAVYGKSDILPRPGGSNTFHILNNASFAILDDTAASRLTRKLILPGPLNSLLPLIVDISKSKHVRSKL